MAEPAGRDPPLQPGTRRMTRNQAASLQSSQEDIAASGCTVNVKSEGCTLKVEAHNLERLDSTSQVPECAVCLQSCVHPVRLPCSHIFCYLCVKGVAFQSRRCAMCRQEIPADFLLHPQLLDRNQLEKESSLEDGYQWFYEGRNGWWKYDDRTASDIERSFHHGEEKIELLIAGANYVIDLKELIQYPKNRSGRVRKILRCHSTADSVEKLGVAGWWQYDERTSIELESAYKRSQRVCELLIAGFLYMIDFDQMLQYRKSDPSRRRRIKRDLATIPKKGVAGLRLDQTDDDDSTASLDLLAVAANRAALTSNCLSPSQTPQVPSNTPQTPQTPRSPPSPVPDSSAESELADQRWQERERRRLRRAVEEIERLRLHDEDDATSHSDLSRLNTLAIYYNLDEEAELIDRENHDHWPSEGSSSEDDEKQAPGL